MSSQNHHYGKNYIYAVNDKLYTTTRSAKESEANITDPAVEILPASELRTEMADQLGKDKFQLGDKIPEGKTFKLFSAAFPQGVEDAKAFVAKSFDERKAESDKQHADAVQYLKDEVLTEDHKTPDQKDWDNAFHNVAVKELEGHVDMEAIYKENGEKGAKFNKEHPMATAKQREAAKNREAAKAAKKAELDAKNAEFGF